LDRIVILAIQMEQHMAEAQRVQATDLTKHTKHMDIIKQIKNTLKNPIAYLRKDKTQNPQMMGPGAMNNVMLGGQNGHPQQPKVDHQKAAEVLVYLRLTSRPYHRSWSVL